MGDSGNYGFLTRDGTFYQPPTLERLSETNAAYERRCKKSNSLAKADLLVGLENSKSNKIPWWKTLFGRKKNNIASKPLLRHNSDQNLCPSPANNKESVSKRSIRNRKCVSVIENRRLDIFDDIDLTSGAKNLMEYQCDDSAFFNPQMTLKSNETSSNQKSNIQACENPEKEQQPHLSVINEDTVSNVQSQNKDAVQNKTTKPTKPPRKHMSLKHSTTSTVNAHDGVGKPKVKRSKSLLSLRNPFSRSKHTKSDKSNDHHSAEDLLNDVKTKLSKMECEANSFNIYEKYPRRNNDEQPKFLVHIQTKEEMPIKDGVPQWDAQSYQYVTQRTRPRSDIVRPRPHSEMVLSFPSLQPQKKAVESSFIGTSSSSVNEADACSATVAVDSETKPLIIDDSKLQLKGKPGETNCTQRHQMIEAEIHAKKEKLANEVEELDTSETPKATISKPEDFLNQKKEEKESKEIIKSQKKDEDNFEPASRIGFVAGAKISKGVHLRSASVDDKLFGCSFVLTGVDGIEDKFQSPDSILSKHPYLAHSTPLKHMAKCLRQASHTDMPKKLSPIQVTSSSDFPPPPDSWTESSHDDLTIKKTENSAHSTLFELLLSPATNRHQTPGLRFQRRCLSDSDLSSFYLTPMKLNDRYDVTEKSFGGNQSRNTRTKLLLHRMKNRIERLEKLTGTNSTEESNENTNRILTQVGQKMISNELSAPKKKMAASSRVKALRNLGANSLKRSLLLQNSEKPGTSLKQFKKLINNQIVKGKMCKASASHFPKRDKHLVKVDHGQMFTEPIYDYLWPQNEYETGTESNSELSFASLPNCASSIMSKLHSNSSSVTVTPPSTSSLISSDSSLMTSPKRSFSSSLPKLQQYCSTSIKTNSKGYENNNIAEHGLNESSGKLVKESANADFDQVAVSRQNQDIFENEIRSKNCSSDELFPDKQTKQHDKIKLTMLEEMQRISTKYSKQIGNPGLPMKFDDWKNELRFYWQDGFFENKDSYSSDPDSQRTLKHYDSDATSSGDTLVNDIETMSDRSSTVFDHQKSGNTDSNRFSKSCNRLKAKEYVINYDANDVQNFMDWDCDETDL